MPESVPNPETTSTADRATCSRADSCAQNALRLAEAVAQIEELVEANQRLRSDLSEMTLKWAKAAWLRGGSLG
jgi:hypothetical protein